MGEPLTPEEIAELGTLACEECGELLVYEGILVNDGAILRGEEGEVLQVVCDPCFGEGEEPDE